MSAMIYIRPIIFFHEVFVAIGVIINHKCKLKFLYVVIIKKFTTSTKQKQVTLDSHARASSAQHNNSNKLRHRSRVAIKNVSGCLYLRNEQSRREKT